MSTGSVEITLVSQVFVPCGYHRRYLCLESCASFFAADLASEKVEAVLNSGDAFQAEYHKLLYF